MGRMVCNDQGRGARASTEALEAWALSSHLLQDGCYEWSLRWEDGQGQQW